MIKIKNVIRREVQPGKKPLSNIKNIILLSSGKGGVGKSTITTNLAIYFVQMGANIGILDADIYGPSQPTLLNLKKYTKINKEKKIIPLIKYGVKMISIGNLIDSKSAVIWRGPIASKTIIQLLNNTDWGNIDYLFLDLPPGTGDIQLTISKYIPVTCSIIITTPQYLSLIDAQRSITLFKKVNIKILGIIENMSYYICPKCNNHEYIFGNIGAKSLSIKNNIKILGHLPLDKNICENSDNGLPCININNNDIISKSYIHISKNILNEIEKLPKLNNYNSFVIK